MPTLWQAVTTAPTPATRPSSLACSNSGPNSSGAPPITVLESPTMTSSFLARDMATLTRLGSFKNPIGAVVRSHKRQDHGIRFAAFECVHRLDVVRRHDAFQS